MLQAQSVAVAADASIEIREEIATQLAEVEKVEKTQRLVTTLFDIQASMGDILLPNGNHDFPGADARYEQAFKDYGTDLFRLTPEQGAEFLRSLGTDLRVQLAAALDDWAYVRYVQASGMQNSLKLFEITRLLDPDPLRNRIRKAATASDGKTLQALAEEINPAVQPVQTINLVAVYLYFFRRQSKCTDAIRFLRRAQPFHTADFQIAHNLAFHLLQDSLPEQAIPYSTAAVAIRPNSAAAWQDLCRTYYDSGRFPEAVGAFRRFIALAPKNASPRFTLGLMLLKMRDVDGAVAEFKAALQIDPKHRGALGQLAEAHLAGANLVAASETVKDLLGIDPKDGFALYLQSRVERARALLPRLPDILDGKAEPTSSLEGCEFADLCTMPGRKQYLGAARLYEKAFASDATLLTDLGSGHRLTAARAAILAASGAGVSTKPLTPAEVAEMRRLALTWARAEVALCVTALNQRKPESRQIVLDKLTVLRNDVALAVTKTGATPGRLEMPAEERTRWDQFWTQVEMGLLEAWALP
jgi:tetratricopeptide (TPR) repeat protein